MGNRKPFNFGDAPLVQDTERTVESGYEAIEQKEQGGRPTTNRPTPNPISADAPTRSLSLNGGESMPAAPAEHGTAGDAAATAAATPAPAPAEPTKGVQTYIPMSQYRRLNDIKLTRRENIADLAAQAINLWLDVQEGKLVVTKPE